MLQQKRYYYHIYNRNTAIDEMRNSPEIQRKWNEELERRGLPPEFETSRFEEAGTTIHDVDYYDEREDTG
jgi:hypothetical protein